MSNLRDRVIAELPESTAVVFRRCLERAPQTIESLESELDAYLRDVRMMAEQDDFSDPGYAEELAERCRKMLSQIRDTETHAVVQAAVLYLAKCDDDRSDVSSLVGVEDDADVIVAVEHVLGGR